MKVLLMGKPYGTPLDLIERYRRARCAHDVRTLACAGPADFSFDPSETMETVLARISQVFSPDLFVCWCPENLPPPLAVEGATVKTVAVISDWTVYFPQLAANLGRFDVVVADRLGASVLPRLGMPIHYLGPLYSHRTDVHWPRDAARDLDIVFAGNLNPAVHDRRGRVLDRLAAMSGRRRVVIATELPPEEYALLHSRARIVFNHSLRREMNLRCFEGPACGALLFMEDDNMEIGDLLRPGEEYVAYNEDNLEALLDEVLDNPSRCEILRAAGHAKISQCSGEARLDGLLEAVAALPESGRPFLQESPERQTMAGVLLYGASQVAAQQALAKVWIADALRQYPDNPLFIEAQGISLLEQLSHLPGEARRARLPEALACLKNAVVARPDAAPLWLNLAFAAHLAGATAAEEGFMKRVLRGDSLAGAELLMGDRRDSYYAQWRVREAMGDASPSLLHAAAECRLAALALERDAGEAAGRAARSVALWPGMAAPYEVWAGAEERLGRPERAAELLAESLPMTSLDSDHRAALVRLYRETGREELAQSLSQESRHLFNAWRGAEHAAARFA